MDLKSEKLPVNMSLSASDQQEFNKSVKQLKEKGSLEKGVIYLGHIPHGFFEEQMKQYFSQFGEVTRLRLARSKRTGRMRGYAFVEFACDAVAKIAADSMNNYLMFHKLLKCQYLPSEKVHQDMFVGSDRKFKKPKSHLIAIERHNSVKSEKKLKESIKKATKKNKKTSALLAEMGIEYKFNINKPTIKQSSKKAVPEKKIADIPVEYQDDSSSGNEDENQDNAGPKAKKKRVQSPVSKRKRTDSDNKQQVETPQVKSKRQATTPGSGNKMQKMSKAVGESTQKSPKSVKKTSKSPLTGRQVAKPSPSGNSVKESKTKPNAKGTKSKAKK